jgi:hypothetical protein
VKARAHIRIPCRLEVSVSEVELALRQALVAGFRKILLVLL